MSDAATTNDRLEGAVGGELVGDSLEIGYDSTDEPIVECDHVVLPAGEVTALVGPNGSGKSTLLKALAGQLQPWAGAVTVDDTDVYAMDDKARARRIGLLSQERESPGSTTVEELVTHGRYPYRGFLEPVDGDDVRAVDRAIERTGIEELRDRQLGELSGGQSQLAWIAMVLAQDPDVLLLDEPTTFLDLRHRLQVLETVQSLNRENGMTVGLVLHDIAQAARYADNLVAIRDGSPYDWGPPTEVVTEDLLADVFGVDATVTSNGNPGPEVMPHGPLD
ncbi:ABC transporter ATP-binding protein [Natronomonas sp.]|uniref:ABC transporter ATP-binding protein n=1 Tax=Natronomonas sp. TaxID=2184060 RepID=UPI002FC3874D